MKLALLEARGDAEQERDVRPGQEGPDLPRARARDGEGGGEAAGKARR